MIRWIVSHLIGFIVSVIILAAVIFAFFALGGFDYLMSVIDGVVQISGGVRG